MWVLGALLVFTGLLLAGLAPAATLRSRRGRMTSLAISKLRPVRVSDAPSDGALVAVRGSVEAEAPLTDPITGEEVVWYEIELDVPDAPVDVSRAETRFSVRDESGSVPVVPSGAREVAVRIDVFEPGDRRDQVASYLKRNAVIHRADISLTHRRIAVGEELLVVGRRDAEGAFAAGESGDLTLTTHSLEALQERELASAKSSKAGAVLLFGVGFVCAAVGAAVLTFA